MPSISGPLPATLRRRHVLGAALAAASVRVAAAPTPGVVSRWFTTSDGVRLHYLDAGTDRPGRPTLVFVPGWTMPAWIWAAQLDHFAERGRAIAFDPRGQGRSAAPVQGYEHGRRGADIGELLSTLGSREVVLVGWSLAVLECLRHLHDARLSGSGSPVQALVLVDNSVGEGEPPRSDPTFLPRLAARRRETMQGFVHGMFKTPPPQPWLDELVEATLRMPKAAALGLLRQPTPREFWRDALYALGIPVLYLVTPRFARQAELASARKSTIQSEVFEAAGHALFVDAPDRFNERLQHFIEQVAARAGDRK